MKKSKKRSGKNANEGNLHVTIEMHILQVAIELRALFHVDITHKLVPTAFCTRNNRPVFCKAFIFNYPCISIADYCYSECWIQSLPDETKPNLLDLPS